MKRSVQAVLLISLGGAVLHATVWTDLYLRYVKETLRIPLIISAVLLVLLGLASLPEGIRVAVRRRRVDPPANGHRPTVPPTSAGREHDHAQGPRAAWLLLLPTVMLVVLAPPALGSYTAARDALQPVEPVGARTLPSKGTVPLTMSEFAGRFNWDQMDPLRGRTVRLAGFVTPAENGRWYLSRLVVNCCAADASALKVEIRGAHAPPTDTWVTVAGVWHPTEPDGGRSIPVLDAHTVHEILTPRDPYNDTLPPERHGGDPPAR